MASVEVVDYLLSLGVNSEARNNDAQTALEMVKTLGANDYGHDEIIALLGKYGSIE